MDFAEKTKCILKDVMKQGIAIETSTATTYKLSDTTIEACETLAMSKQSLNIIAHYSHNCFLSCGCLAKHPQCFKLLLISTESSFCTERYINVTDKKAF